MREVIAGPMLAAISALESMLAGLRAFGARSLREHTDGSVTITEISDPVLIGLMSQQAQSLNGYCLGLRANVTVLALDEFRQSLLPGAFLTYEVLERGLSDISATFRRELTTIKFLSLSLDEQQLYQKPSLFGAKVEAAFSSAIDDIAEAGNCLALDRGTATVFHLMRVMEAGLKALAAELGVPYAPSWESYITQLNSLLDGANYAKLTAQQRAKRPFYQDVLGDLTSVKSAWRNPTMHIVKSYDPKQAKLVFLTVEGFMQHLADNLAP